MKVALLAITGIDYRNLNKQIALLLATMAIVIALPFSAVFAMGGGVVTFLSNVPSIEAAENLGFYTGGPIEGNTYAWGNCTYWTFAMRLWAGYPIPTGWGNANTWDDRAIRDGYLVNQTPAVGAIFQTDDGEYGHVAYVKAVNPENGTWTISEMNYAGYNIVSTRTFNSEAATNYSFIHGKIGASEWNPLPISLP